MKKTLVKKDLAIVLVAVTLLTFMLPSVALATPWTVAGSSSTVDESDIGRFATNSSYINFRPGATGPIRARYNVTNPFDGDPVHDNWNRLYVSFKDPGMESRIYVYLRAMDLVTGASTPIARFDSDDFPASDLVQLQDIPIPIGYMFDFESKVYFIEVRLTRDDPSAQVAVVGLKLDFLP